MTYIPVTEVQSNPFAPGTSELFKQLRDNPIAIAGGLVGAPKVVSEGLDVFSASAEASGASPVDYIDLDRMNKIMLIGAGGVNYQLSTDNGATFGTPIIAPDGLGVVSLGSTYNAIRISSNHTIIGLSGVTP